MGDELATQSTGGTGGLVRPHGRSRQVLRILQGAISRGTDVGEEGLQKGIEYANSLLDDPEASSRDKLRATELLAAIANKGIDVALHYDKREQEEDEKPKKITAREYTIEFDRGG